MRRRVVGLVAAVLAGVLPAGFATSSPGSGGDCGGPDTPPAYQLTSGITCNGSHDEPATTTTDRTEMGYKESLFADRYDIAATDGDLVRIDSTTRVCFTTTPSGSFIAEGNGAIGITITARQTFELGTSTPKMPCPDTPGSYTVRATVTPNDRPDSVSASGVPTSVMVGQSFTFTVSGTDPDGNLEALGVGFGSSVEWKQLGLTTGSSSVQFTYEMYNTMTFKVYARDSLGAVKESVTSYTVMLAQNDCSLGRDANSEPVTLPFDCHGYLSPSSHDQADSFTFNVPSGSRPHATFENGAEWGQVLRLVSPSGAETFSGSEEVFGTLEPGTWTLEVRGDGDSVFYDLRIELVGPQAPPVLSILSAPTVGYQGDEYQIQLKADDPNDGSVVFLVEWSDGSGSWWPVNDRAASGEVVTAYRRFLTGATSLSATITAFNSEQLASASQTIDVTIRPHDDCGSGRDLPSEPPSSTGVSLPCAGTLGGGSIEYPYPTDDQDSFVSPARCAIGACKLRVTLTTEAGLGAYVVATTMPGVQQTSSSCGGSGCTASMDILATYPTSSYPVISIRRLSGKGSYTLSISQVPLIS